MSDYEKRVVFITGAVGNLGVAVARAFLSQGAHLVLCDRAGDRLDKVFAGLSPEEHLLAGGVDVTDESSIARAVEKTVARYGRIDVLVNTVGGYRAGKPVHETDVGTWDLMLKLNAGSVFLVSRAVIPHMIGQEGGRIISIAAGAGLKGEAGHGAYSASKSAVIRLTESMSEELKDRGVNVNCVLPSLIDTPPNREAMPNADFDKWVTPESIAAVILFLASPAARDVTGAAVPVAGRV